LHFFSNSNVSPVPFVISQGIYSASISLYLRLILFFLSYSYSTPISNLSLSAYISFFFLLVLAFFLTQKCISSLIELSSLLMENYSNLSLVIPIKVVVLSTCFIQTFYPHALVKINLYIIDTIVFFIKFLNDYDSDSNEILASSVLCYKLCF